MNVKPTSCGSSIDHRSRCGQDGDQCPQCRKIDSLLSDKKLLSTRVSNLESERDALQRVIDEARGQEPVTDAMRTKIMDAVREYGACCDNEMAAAAAHDHVQAKYWGNSRAEALAEVHALLCAPVPAQPSAPVAQPPVFDRATILERAEELIGHGSGAWDTVNPLEIVGAVLEAAGLGHEVSAPVAQPAPAVADAVALLDAYERETEKLPAQHEIPSRGCCTYNWQMAVIRDLRAMLAASAPKEGKPT